MSTRAVYTFSDESGPSYHVYKHHDGYPSGAAQWVEKALAYAWPLPRFEADEFAAAFVAANLEGVKNNPYRGGDVRLVHGYDDIGDLAYRYEIRPEGDTLHVSAFERVHAGPNARPRYRQIFAGPLAEFREVAKNLAAV